MRNNDEAFLRRAIALAAAGRAAGEEPYGSLLVDGSGKVIAEDHNTVLSDKDISAHPEFKLAKWASINLQPEVAATTTMYTSCQPCSMCTGAIDRSGLGRVVFALSNAQFRELEPTAEFASVPQEGPALFDEAKVPVQDFYR